MTAATHSVQPMTALHYAEAVKLQLSPVEQESHLSDQLVLIRHGERQDHVDRSWKGNHFLPVNDPPLSADGRKQAFETALQYYTLQHDRVVERRLKGSFSYIVVSPFHRCIETALIISIVAFQGSIAVYVDPQLADWHQHRVFRAAPTLGGYFVSTTSTEDTLSFVPQAESIKASLLPFLQSQADEDLRNYHINSNTAKRWVNIATSWLQSGGALPVWTHAIRSGLVREAMLTHHTSCSVAGRAGKHSKHLPNGSTSSLPEETRISSTEEEAPLQTVCHRCGIEFPENKSALLKRSQDLVETFFRCTEDTAAAVPDLVRKSINSERKDRLPRFFQLTYPKGMDGAALLPPMHVMMITHADVIASVLETCCPKHHHPNAGSVPYCSVTILQRQNNYYRILPPEARQPLDMRRPASSKGGRSPQTSTANKHNKHTQDPTQGLSNLPNSVDWAVKTVGSMELLTTCIVMRFS